MYGTGFPSRPAQVHSQFLCPHCLKPCLLPNGFNQRLIEPQAVPQITLTPRPSVQWLGTPYNSPNQPLQWPSAAYTSPIQYSGPQLQPESSAEPSPSLSQYAGTSVSMQARPIPNSSPVRPSRSDSKVGDWASLWRSDWSKFCDSKQSSATDRIQPYHEQAFQEATPSLCILYNEFLRRPTVKLKAAGKKEDCRSSTASEAISKLDRISYRMSSRNEAEHRGLGVIQWEVFGEIWSAIFDPLPTPEWEQTEEWQSKKRKYNEGRLKTLVDRCGYPKGWASCPPYYSGTEYSMESYL
ncbi:hypothetical protein N7540_012520 [Penicillium herquei]|nr:hypothetical protein N7540_012520 [Penicillium herquei]